MNDVQPATLYVVATPIGNLGDFSPRARQILAQVDTIAAEDTRVSGRLLRTFGIDARLLSLHEHNETQRVPSLIAQLKDGAAVALVSDAGTPLISDPGYALVSAARAAGLCVLSVPGPCAAVAALSVSGLPSDRFVFAGFLAARASARERQLSELAGQTATLIFYASKRQLGDALAQACTILGAQREAVLCRELTKLYEQTLCGTLGSLRDAWAQTEQRGEWVLLVRGCEAPRADVAALEATLDVLLTRLSTRDAAALAARLLGVPRREAYTAALARSGRGAD